MIRTVTLASLRINAVAVLAGLLLFAAQSQAAAKPDYDKFRLCVQDGSLTFKTCCIESGGIYDEESRSCEFSGRHLSAPQSNESSDQFGAPSAPTNTGGRPTRFGVAETFPVGLS